MFILIYVDGIPLIEVWCMTTINFDTFLTAAVAGAAKSDSSTEVKVWAEYENMKKLAESQSHSRLWQELLWLSCATTLLKIFTFDHTTLHYNMMNASHAVHVTQTTNKQAMQFKFNRLREGFSMSSLCWTCDLYVRWLLSRILVNSTSLSTQDIKLIPPGIENVLTFKWHILAKSLLELWKWIFTDNTTVPR